MDGVKEGMNADRHKTPISWKKNLFFIWASQLLSIAGFASAMPFIPIYIRDTWGITDEKTLGLWMSAFYFFGMLSFCLFTPIWGVLADRFGRKVMLLRACYVDAILFPCFIFAPSPLILIIFRFIVSAFTGTVSAAQTLIVTTTPEDHHGFALGALSSAIWSGNLIGFMAGGLIVHYFGFTAAFCICGGMYLIAGLFAHLFVREDFHRPAPIPASERKRRNPFAGITLGAWFVFLLIIMTAIARRFDDPYVALMVEKIHGPDKTAYWTGWISAAAALGGMISAVGIGRLCDRYSVGRVVVPSIILAGLGMFAQAVSTTLFGFGAARFVNFSAAGGTEPAFFAILSKISPSERRGTLFGLASGLRMAGILLSTLLSGSVIYWVGVRNVYNVAGILFFLILPLLWMARRIIRREMAVQREKS